MTPRPWLLPAYFPFEAASPELSVAFSTMMANGFPLRHETKTQTDGFWLLTGSSHFLEKEEKWLKQLPDGAVKILVSNHPESMLSLKHAYAITGNPARSLFLLAKALSMPVSPFLDHVPGLAFQNMLNRLTILPDELTRDFPTLSAGIPGQSVHVATWVSRGVSQTDWLTISPAAQANGIMVWTGDMPEPAHSHWQAWNPRELTHVWWPRVSTHEQADRVRQQWPMFQAMGFQHLLATDTELSFLPEATWLTIPSRLKEEGYKTPGIVGSSKRPWVVIPSGKNAPNVLSHVWLFYALGGKGTKKFRSGLLSRKIAQAYQAGKKDKRAWWRFWV